MRRLAILGASGHGKVVADTAECCGWNSINFFDDAWPEVQVNDVWPVVGNTTGLLEQLPQYDGFIVAIGSNRIRLEKLLQLRAAGGRMATLVHPAATVSRYANIEEGTVIFAGAVVNASTHIKLGSILNTACSVDHDCVIGRAVHISPGARLAGGVHIGDESWVGIGASVRQLVAIGQRVMVGAGAAVVGDIPDDVMVAGVPAKRLR
ncbi:acetyltransferase [Stutzerimonas decontaminans]|uniref:Acetyltransferase n=1 Tax=Stutzerimonas decontaminans TaxID=3022791 RepID=A0ABX4W2Z0_9GAMM|nr:acetyltransferase [Stutzerimonas decontaminans]MCQ4246370.1 acetyltransferase [Stutzerimonas decontaminans]PNF86822.1 acetyltransferase [Stutzerimonas decontaminans]